MEQNKKELKWLSIVILALVALSLIRAIVNVCINGLPVAKDVPAGMTKELVQIVTIIAFVASLLLLLPQIYLGVKGLKIANGAESGKAHLVWAIVLIVLSAIAAINGISNLTKVFNLDSVMNLLGPAVDVLLFVCYYVYARKIANN